MQYPEFCYQLVILRDNKEPYMSGPYDIGQVQSEYKYWKRNNGQRDSQFIVNKFKLELVEENCDPIKEGFNW